MRFSRVRLGRVLHRCTPSFGTAAFGLVLTFATASAAHVAFDNPTSGQVLVAGETVELAWTDVIPHNTESYDLELYVGAERTPEPIALGLDPSVHSYDWLVPEISCADCAVHVLQRNINYSDYDHTVPIVIVLPDSGDLAGDSAGAAPTQDGETGGVPSAPATATSSGAGADAAALDANAETDTSNEAPAGCTVPSSPRGDGSQTAILVLGLLSLGVMLRRKR